MIGTKIIYFHHVNITCFFLPSWHDKEELIYGYLLAFSAESINFSQTKPNILTDKIFFFSLYLLCSTLNKLLVCLTR